jgi:hypothetical protein
MMFKKISKTLVVRASLPVRMKYAIFRQQHYFLIKKPSTTAEGLANKFIRAKIRENFKF